MTLLEKIRFRLKSKSIDFNASQFYYEGVKIIEAQLSNPVVVIGDSHVARGVWGTWANQGIDEDTSFGVLHRIDLVTRLIPEYCIIQVGINDLDRGVHSRRVYANIREACIQLTIRGIKVILLSVLKVNAGYPKVYEINDRVDSLNRKLKNIPGIEFLKLNIPWYYYSADHLHLTVDGYHFLKEQVGNLLPVQLLRSSI